MRWWLVAPDGTLTKCHDDIVDRLLKKRYPDGTLVWRYAYQEQEAMTTWHFEVICPECGTRLQAQIIDTNEYELPHRCWHCGYPENWKAQPQGRKGEAQ